MPFDFTILNSDGTVRSTASIPMGIHDEIRKLALECGFRYLQRISDFYGEERFDPSELPGLLIELDELETRVPARSRPTIHSLRALIEHARALGCSVHVLPD